MFRQAPVVLPPARTSPAWPGSSARLPPSTLRHRRRRLHTLTRHLTPPPRPIPPGLRGRLECSGKAFAARRHPGLHLQSQHPSPSPTVEFHCSHLCPPCLCAAGLSRTWWQGKRCSPAQSKGKSACGPFQAWPAGLQSACTARGSLRSKDETHTCNSSPDPGSTSERNAGALSGPRFALFPSGDAKVLLFVAGRNCLIAPTRRTFSCALGS